MRRILAATEPLEEQAPLSIRNSLPRLKRFSVFLVRVSHSLITHHATEFASALAYIAFLALVPILALLGFVLGHLVREAGVDAVLGPFLAQAPEGTREIVAQALKSLAGAESAAVAPLAILGFLWVASSGAHGSMDILEMVFGTKARPWWKKRLIALGCVLGSLGILGGVTAALVKIGTHIEEQVVLVPVPRAENAPEAAPGELEEQEQRVLLRKRLVVGDASRAVGVIVAVLFVFFGLAGFYRVAIDSPADLKRRVYPGAAVALVAFFVLSWLFATYVARFGRYVTYYGGLAAIAVLMLWLYLLGIAFLLGAEINMVLEGRRVLQPPTKKRSTTGA